MIKKTILGVAIAAALISAPVFAADAVTVTTGSKGGAYQTYGSNLARILKQMDWDANTQRSKGSVQNLERVAAGEAQLGFTQGDALGWFMKKNAADLEIVGALGKECVFIAYNVDGKVTDEDDLQTEGHSIAVGKKGSGSQVSWEYMTQLEGDYSKSTAQYKGGARAMASLAAGQVDAVMFVTDPSNLDHRLIKMVGENEKLKFMDVDDGDLNDKLPNGDPVYTFEDVKVGSGFWADEVETVCTNLLVVANADADEDLLDDTATIMLSNKNAVTGK